MHRGDEIDHFQFVLKRLALAARVQGRNLWCGRGDLNPHAFRRHPLKMVCLPIPPLPHRRSKLPRGRLIITKCAVSTARSPRTTWHRGSPRPREPRRFLLRPSGPSHSPALPIRHKESATARQTLRRKRWPPPRGSNCARPPPSAASLSFRFQSPILARRRSPACLLSWSKLCETPGRTAAAEHLLSILLRAPAKLPPRTRSASIRLR